MKNNAGVATQNSDKGKTILTTAGAVAVGAVTGAGADRLFESGSNEPIEEKTEENKSTENNATTQGQGNAGQQVAHNAAGQQTSHHGTASHTNQAGANTEVASNENVEAEAVAVAERLVGHNETPNEVDRILNESNGDAVTLYTENGTEVPMAVAFSHDDDDVLAEMKEEDFPEDLFEEDSDSLFSDSDTNEMADLVEGSNVDEDDDSDILEI